MVLIHMKKIDVTGLGTFIKSNTVAVVECRTDWCKGCGTLEVIMDDIEKKMDNNGVSFGILDITEKREIINKYHISSVPTLLLFKNGEYENSLVGSRNREAILDSIYLLMERTEI